MTPPRRLALGVATLAAAVAALHAAGSALGSPPLTSPGSWSSWLSDREPVEVAFSLARLGALAGAWYLLAVTVLGALARLAGTVRLTRGLDRVTVPAVRRLLATGLSVSLLGAGVAASAGSLARPAVAAAAGGAPSPTEPATSIPDPGPPSTVTMHRLPDAAPEPAPHPGPAGQQTQWRVEPGQCFWSIAEAVLAAAGAARPSEADVVAYWHRLIEANRHVLADPGNPDLLFPGQVLAVPPGTGGAPASLAPTT